MLINVGCVCGNCLGVVIVETGNFQTFEHESLFVWDKFDIMHIYILKIFHEVIFHN
jgi:hypothetical protein